MTTVDQFAARMGELGRSVESGRARLLREAALRIDQTLVLATPVDTGRARSNWIVSINAPVNQPRPAFAPTSPLNSSALTLLNNRFGERENAAAALAASAGTIASVSPGDTIFISNNLPYIGELDDGKSPQAPAGYIREAIGDAVAGLRGVRILGD